MPASSIHTSARLYYQDGSSDKEYHAAINAVDGGYTVTFAYGRRGSALQAGTKTSSPVPLQKAVQIYDKLIAEKTSKGYTPDGTGALFAMTENENRVSGLAPQLLNVIDETVAVKHITDDAWCMQEKFDGRRIMTAIASDQVAGSNRKGLYVSMPQEIADALSGLPDCVVDGELLGGAYVVFDLLSVYGQDIRPQPYRDRYNQLASIVRGSTRHHGTERSIVDRPAFAGSPPLGAEEGKVPEDMSTINARLIRLAETAWTADEKQAMYNRIAAARGEGVVFKKVDGKSVAGRPASGGSQVKCKFYATCTCVVTAQNDQRSVRLHLLDDRAAVVSVGNVTIPANKVPPPAGALVEIRYLYAYRGGSLYQPHYLGERDDVSLEDCRVSQLKFKPEGYAAEGDGG